MPKPQAAATLPAVGSDAAGAGPGWLHLRSGGVSLLLQVFSSGLPAVLYWGADLGELGDAATMAVLLPGREPGSIGASIPAIIPGYGAGWLSDPGLNGAHEGRTSTLRFPAVEVRLVSETVVQP